MAIVGSVVGVVIIVVAVFIGLLIAADDTKCASAERYGNPGSTFSEKFVNLCWVPGRGAETEDTP